MASDPLLGAIQTEFRNEIAVLQFNTSLIIAELRRINKRMVCESKEAKRKRRVLIGSDSESDEDISIEDTTDTDSDGKSEEPTLRAVPRRSKRARGISWNSDPDAVPVQEDPDNFDHGSICGSIRLHREDGPYITGIVKSSIESDSPVARIRWLKPLYNRAGCNVFVYCDWPAQEVDLVNSHTLSAVPVISDAREMHWDHLQYNTGAVADGFPEEAFEVLPYYYEYASGTTADFTRLFHFMLESEVHSRSTIRDKTDYKVGVLSLLSECYGQGSSYLYNFGTRTDADSDANMELARMASDVSTKKYEQQARKVQKGQRSVCDCCNKRCLIVSKFMNIDMCGACRDRFVKLVKLTDAIKMPEEDVIPLKNSVLDRFSSLMYSFCEIV